MMGTVKEKSAVYDILLSVPGMAEQVRVDIKVSRKCILLLAQHIQRGLAREEADGESVLGVVSMEYHDELLTIASELLTKGGLVELDKKLDGLK